MTKTATAVRIPTARRGPAGTTPPGGTFRRDVAGLRAVAVALVVLFDAGLPGLTGGYAGVDVLFAISGYLITGTLLREADTTGRISLVAFYSRRARRILPAACLVLVVVLLAARHWFGAVDGVTPSPLLHFWPLAIVAPFYVLWPIVLALPWQFGADRLVPFILGCTTGGSLAWSVLHAGLSSFSLSTRTWELSAGALLALVGNDRHRIPHRLAGALSWLGLALILAAALVYRRDTPFPGIAAVVPVLGALLVLAGRGEGLLSLPPLQWLGRISYSLYLWHWPVLVIAAQDAGGRLPGPVRGLLLLGCVGLAKISYMLVEKPIRRNARLRSSPGLTLAVSLLLVAAPLAAAGETPRWGALIGHVQP